MFIRAEDINTLAISAETKEMLLHLQRVIETHEYLPMVNPETGKVEIKQIDAPTTVHLDAIIDEFRAVLSRQFAVNSNPCYCWMLYQSYEAAKAQIVEKTRKQSVRTQELAAINEEIKERWGYVVPSRYAESGQIEKCPHCGKPKAIPDVLAFTDPAFRHKIIALTVGGDIPLNFLVLFLSYVDKWVYNPDVIPESKKKQVQAFLDKTGLLSFLGRITAFLRGETPAATTTVGATLPKPSATSTATTASVGDSPLPTWTPDSPPVSDSSTTANTNAISSNV